MNRLFRLSMVITLAVALLAPLGAPPSLAQATGTCLPDGVQDSGAIYRICMPPQWNGELVVYAHGYVSPTEPVGIPEDQLVLPDGTSIPDLINSLGFAFATTSYSKNGLAVLPGLDDLVDLVGIFKGMYPETKTVFLTGVSEGGLITALGIERHPDVFDGGLSACGPVGSFPKQINYWDDFRVTFDYFFPGVLPPTAINIPQQLMDEWDAVYAPAVSTAIAANPHATEQLLQVNLAPTDPNDPGTIEDTTLGLLWYNVFATNDGQDTLGGQPFDNTKRIYLGSDNDWALNWGVKRYAADPAAVAEMNAYYQTSGKLTRPLITMHTTGDPIVPYWHELLYGVKVLGTKSAGQYLTIPIFRYGHCAFTPEEVLAAFALLVLRVDGFQPTWDPALPTAAGPAQAVYLPLMNNNAH